MGVEIERKFLLADEKWRLEADEGTDLAQGYLVSDSVRAVRVRLANDRAWLTIKGARLGISRMEFEYPIPVDDASSILENLCNGSVLRKTRYRVRCDPHVWEIDEFHGDNAGLVVAEIELGAEEEDFRRPPWLGEEVSDDPRYLNASLVANPWIRWGARSGGPR